LTLIERITDAIRETESAEDRSGFRADVDRFRKLRDVLLDARDELQRAAPIVPRRDTLTLGGKAA